MQGSKQEVTKVVSFVTEWLLNLHSLQYFLKYFYNSPNYSERMIDCVGV